MGYSREFGSLQKESLDVTPGVHGVKTLFLGQIKKVKKKQCNKTIYYLLFIFQKNPKLFLGTLQYDLKYTQVTQ